MVISVIFLVVTLKISFLVNYMGAWSTIWITQDY